MLIIYFAGFFTAIYILSPAPDENTASLDNTNTSQFTFDTFDGQEKAAQAKDIAIKVGNGMQQFLCVAGEKASQISEKIKARLEEQNQK